MVQFSTIPRQGDQKQSTLWYSKFPCYDVLKLHKENVAIYLVFGKVALYLVLDNVFFIIGYVPLFFTGIGEHWLIRN